MVRIEDRLSEQVGVETLSSYKKKDSLKNAAYYERLLEDLDTPQSETKKKAASGEASTAAQASGQKFRPKMKAQFKWGKDSSGEYCIKAEQKQSVSKGFSGEKASSKILNFLGYKIDVSSKVDSFKVKYQKYFIESRSHNFLLGKFSELKFGFVQSILSVLGVTTEELQSLQKKALKTAITENLSLYEQNEYNMEMLLIFGNKKKDKGKIKVLQELKQQLESQMSQLEQKGFYSKEKTLEISKSQVEKIWQEMRLEEQNLKYYRDFV